MICNAGGAVAIVEYITEAKGNPRLPGIITLGYISAFDESLAMSVIASKGKIYNFFLFRNRSFKRRFNKGT